MLYYKTNRMRRLNPYLKLLIITFIFTGISYIFELYYDTSLNKLEYTNNIGLFAFRYIHYLFLFYFSCFLLLFSYKGIDAMIFLISSIIMTASWVFLDCCIVSYYELKMYNENHADYLTSFHPCLFVVFNEYQGIPLMLTGLFMFITFYFILMKTRIIPLAYKVAAGVIFAYLFIDNIIKTRVYDTKLRYPTDENHILYKYFTFC